MGRAGRKFKVAPQVLIETINLHKKELFLSGKVAGPSTSVYKVISDSLDSKISPYAVYVFIKRNKLAKVKYNEWGLVDEIEAENAANPSMVDHVDNEGKHT